MSCAGSRCLGCPMCAATGAAIAASIVYLDKKFNPDGSLWKTALIAGGTFLGAEFTRSAMCAVSGMPRKDPSGAISYGDDRNAFFNAIKPPVLVPGQQPGYIALSLSSR